MKEVEIGDLVKVKADGSIGIVRILEGVPPYKAYVDMEPGANGGYVYLKLNVPAEDQYIEGEPTGPSILALNPYSIDELEVIFE